MNTRAFSLYTRFQQIITAVALLFILFLLRSQWGELRVQSWRLHPGWLTLSTLFLLLSWSTEIRIWQRILVLLGNQLAYGVAVRIWFLSAITRYVPGNVWQPLSITLRCQRKGVRPEATVASVLLFQLVILLAAGPVAALYFGISKNYGLLTNRVEGLAEGDWSVVIVVLVLLPILVLFLVPDGFFTLVNWGLMKVGRPNLHGTLSRWHLFHLVALALVHWLFWGLTFGSLTFSLGPYTITEMRSLAPHLVASFAIAYTVGFLSFLTPSGIGVREGTFYILLAPLIGGGTAAVAALAMRIWSTLGELVMALISLLAED